MFRFLPSLAATLLSCLLGAVLFQPAFAQPLEWPTRTVKFIVPLGAGSGADIGARLLALDHVRQAGVNSRVVTPSR